MDETLLCNRSNESFLAVLHLLHICRLRVGSYKTVTEVLKRLTEATGRWQHFQARTLTTKWTYYGKFRLFTKPCFKYSAFHVNFTFGTGDYGRDVKIISCLQQVPAMRYGCRVVLLFFYVALSCYCYEKPDIALERENNSH